MADIWKFAHPYLRDLIPYEPGKPIEDVARDLGIPAGEIIKLASNENPLGPSPKALEAMKAACERAHFYPDGGGYYLREGIAKKFGLARENIILGNGSNEIIELLGHGFLKPGDEIVTSQHAFAVYGLMATLFGATTVEVLEQPGFIQDLEAMLAAVTPRTRQLFITNPNNPTGTCVTAEAIDKFMAAVPDHVTVVFDEAYYEFLDTPPDTLRYVREGRNVVIMRTFSKSQGLAGLRIGYGFAGAQMAEVLQKCRQPFNANLIAQAGALAALEDGEHQRRTKELTDAGREQFYRGFEALGLTYVPSAANFVLVRVGDGDKVFKDLMKFGVIVRAMRGYKLPDWVRVSVGTPEQNARFLELLPKVLG
jgi:histidinol-phosphate aminotransferase